MTTTAQARAREALEALRAARPGEAERLARAACEAAPRDPDVLRTFGAALSALDRHPEAAEAFRRLCDLDLALASDWMNLGTALRGAGDLAGARAAYERARSLGEDSADFHFSVGMLELDRGDVRAARGALELAAQRAPTDAEIRFQHARVCFAGVDTDAMQDALRDWRSWRGLTPETAAAVASLLLQAGEQDDALELMQAIEAAGPRAPEIELQMIGMLERVNRVEEAARRFAGLAEPDAPAQKQRWTAVRAQLAGRAGDLAQAERLYRELLASKTAPDERQQVLFPLAKILDSAGKYREALQVIQDAHAAQVETVDRTAANPVEADRPVMAITAYSATREDARRWHEPAPPTVADSPIFIVAFPRSGTTLLELMLDAHPALQTMDEQPFLQKAVLRFGDLGLEYPHALAGMTPEQLAEVRRYYWSLVSTKVRLRPGQRLIDKNPLNMLRLPAIRRMFPNAPILLAIRHPCDVIISNFFQHYRAPEFVRLCRDLPTLALGWRKSFDYWYEQAAIVEPRVLEVRYESFVADFERQSRAVADFLGLEWHDAMLEPAAHARQKGYISTPSYSQVVQPVNTKAVGKWRRYEFALAPVLAEVAPYLRRWSYDA